MSVPRPVPRRLLVAVGGNAIHPGNIEGTVSEQVALAERTGEALLPLMAMDNELVITHGNGPVVGKIIMRQALSRERVAPMSLDICVAHSQGGIAYLLMQALENTLRRAGNPRHVVCLLTQVEVDEHDPAFDTHSKPVGYFFDQAEAQALEREFGWQMRAEGDRGYRHVVPSPEPRHVVDLSLIQTVAASGAVVIAGGGGGIPVVRSRDGTRRGVSAVIDKDLVSAHMASVMELDAMLILTEADGVALNYGKPGQRWLREVTVDELRAHQSEGHFPPGNMGPKVEAALRFVEHGGRRAIIGNLFEAQHALLGTSGTQVLPASG